VSFSEFTPLLVSTRRQEKRQRPCRSCKVRARLRNRRSNLLAFLEFEPFVDVGDDGRLAGETENIGAQAEDTRGDVLIGAVYQADDGDDCSHPDDHADQRENTAKFVRQRLEAEITTASERSIVLGEPDRIGVDVDTSAMKGPHPNIRAGCARITWPKGGCVQVGAHKTERNRIGSRILLRM